MTVARPAPALTQGRLALADGRSLAWAEYGVPGGRPVLYFHGTPGCRLEAALASGPAAGLGLRLVAVDRPGYGGSSPQAARTPASFASDVARLAAHLGLACPALLGVSGGGPFAAAAGACPELGAGALALVCPVGPLDPGAGAAALPRRWRLLRRLTRHPRLTAGLLSLASGPVRHSPRCFLRAVAHALPAADRAVLGAPEVAATLAAALGEALRQGPAGLCRDLENFAGDWRRYRSGLARQARIWHGTNDRVVPFGLGQTAARALGTRRLHRLEGEGHFSLPLRHAETILAALAAAGGGRPHHHSGPPSRAGEETMDERIRTFLSAAAFGVAGASTNRAKYGNKVLRCYLQNGRRAIPVHPGEAEIEGQACVPSVAELPAEVTSLSVITPPAVTERIVAQAIARGIRNIWMQPGAESPAAVAAGRAAGLNVIADGSCLLVVLGYREG